MGLMDSIKDDEEKLKKATKAEDEGGQDDEDLEEEGNDEDLDDDSGDDEDADDKKAAKKPDDKDKKAKTDKKGAKKDDADGEDDDSDEDEETDPKKKNDFAAQARQERKKRMKLEEELAALRKAPPPAQQPAKPVEQGKPKQETDAEKLARIDNEQKAERQARENSELRNRAIDEFNTIETEFAKETPDYEDASTHVIKEMIRGVRSTYPEATEKQALAFVQNRVLQIASNAVKRGLNPAEVLYQMAYETYGFEPGAGGKKKEGNGKADNLKNIAKNKKRSASPLSGGGQNAGARATIEEAEKMDLAAFGNMSESEIDELIQQAGS